MSKSPKCKKCDRLFDQPGDIFVDVITAQEMGIPFGGFYMCMSCWELSGQPRGLEFTFRKAVISVKYGTVTDEEIYEKMYPNMLTKPGVNDAASNPFRQL